MTDDDKVFSFENARLIAALNNSTKEELKAIRAMLSVVLDSGIEPSELGDNEFAEITRELVIIDRLIAEFKRVISDYSENSFRAVSQAALHMALSAHQRDGGDYEGFIEDVQELWEPVKNANDQRIRK